ncbi:HIT domain-containing protein [Nocardia testacea]|uniref:HIT domain-containing protein n=1 Tax=Nocardia testacea TaxID=248551 RepID=UPI003C2C80BF
MANELLVLRARVAELENVDGCPFCQRITEQAYEQRYSYEVVRFEPLRPVTPGHQLFVPTRHAEHPDAEAVRTASGYAVAYAETQGEPFNLITSAGAEATQTIDHIHIHYVPRRAGDGLALPWTGQQRTGEVQGPLPRERLHEIVAQDARAYRNEKRGRAE